MSDLNHNLMHSNASTHACHVMSAVAIYFGILTPDDPLPNIKLAGVGEVEMADQGRFQSERTSDPYARWCWLKVAARIKVVEFSLSCKLAVIVCVDGGLAPMMWNSPCGAELGLDRERRACDILSSPVHCKNFSHAVQHKD